MLYNLSPFRILVSISMFAIATTTLGKTTELQKLEATCGAATNAEHCFALSVNNECIWESEQCKVHMCRYYEGKFSRLAALDAVSGTAVIVASLFSLFKFNDPAAGITGILYGVFGVYLGYKLDRLATLIQQKMEQNAH